MLYENFIICMGGTLYMDKEIKTYSMSIRVSKDELNKLKQAARLEAYASYSEFVRRTALLEADEIIQKKETNNKG